MLLKVGRIYKYKDTSLPGKFQLLCIAEDDVFPHRNRIVVFGNSVVTYWLPVREFSDKMDIIHTRREIIAAYWKWFRNLPSKEDLLLAAGDLKAKGYS